MDTKINFFIEKALNPTFTFFGVDDKKKSGELIDFFSKSKLDTHIDKDSCSFFLRLGFIPAPMTGLCELSRDSIFRQDSDQFRFSAELEKFPFFQNESEESTELSEAELLTKFSKELERAVEKSIDRSKNYLLMLSGGKDSTAILLTLASLGYSNISCATYVSGIKEDESTDASRLCSKLGFKHLTVTSNIKREFELLLNAESHSRTPVGDFALPGYLYTIEEALKEFKFDTVIDGMGNDIYMGHIAARSERRLQKLSIPRIMGKMSWGRFNGAKAPDAVSYVFQSLQMLPVERFFSGSRLSVSMIKELGFPVDKMWAYLRSLDDSIGNLSSHNARAFVRGGLYDDLSCCEKGRVSAKLFDLDIVFPFLDTGFAKFYMNLPTRYRYNLKTSTNKVFLRQHIDNLMSSLGIEKNEYTNKKGSFRYNTTAFVSNNLDDIEKLFFAVDDKYPELNFSKNGMNLILNRNNYTISCQIYILVCFSSWLLVQRK